MRVRIEFILFSFIIGLGLGAGIRGLVVLGFVFAAALSLNLAVGQLSEPDHEQN